ncbi:MAG: rhodanese-related sulfurtransferase [Leptolyngbyaceae cyanobacterium RM1_406_9]|nr:rhodanese-related sulfurtransferase [Leptolyngbyaceae cyanobacterium RM1_406_9]
MTAQASNSPIARISVEELAERLAAGDRLQLIDVREPEELAIASLEQFQNLPLSQFAQWSGQIQTQLDPAAETIVMCHHGVRSAQMCHWLINQGFTQVKNLTGGIDAYSTSVDPTVPRY